MIEKRQKNYEINSRDSCEINIFLVVVYSCDNSVVVCILCIIVWKSNKKIKNNKTVAVVTPLELIVLCEKIGMRDKRALIR